ncbi:MAG: hypothetical protein LBP42_07910 [Treponema sp.]|jgi:hypothetical protein|nr:hypothetical protein [Treponema sp.]
MNVQDRYITDDAGRILMLRGCSLGEGPSNPAPGGADLGRGGEFSPEEAEEHFALLSSRGFTFIRLPLTWEALEHEGPGIYDEAYPAYLRKILLIAEKRGLSVFITPGRKGRQTGWEGFPPWVPEKFGFDAERRESAKAYALSTLFTLFFAGNAFAPELFIDGVRAQDWLQERYLAALRHCYRRLKNCAALAGWSAMGEPKRGFIGAENLAAPNGVFPSPFQSMAAASGYKGISLFKPGYGCPWKQAGVWTDEGGKPRLLKEDYFYLFREKRVCFADDFLKPLIRRFTEQMREIRKKAIILVEGVPGEGPLQWRPEDGPGAVYAFSFSGNKKPEAGGADHVPADFSDFFEENRFIREGPADIPCLAGAWDPPAEGPSRYYDFLDKNLIHGAVETYRPDAPLEGMTRPYPLATAGLPLSIHWDPERSRFTYRYRSNPDIGPPTEIYIPPAQSRGEPGFALEIREPESGPEAAMIRAFYDPRQGKGIIANDGYRGDIEIVITFSERKNSSIRF